MRDQLFEFVSTGVGDIFCLKCEILDPVGGSVLVLKGEAETRKIFIAVYPDCLVFMVKEDGVDLAMNHFFPDFPLENVSLGGYSLGTNFCSRFDCLPDLKEKLIRLVERISLFRENHKELFVSHS